MIRGTNTVPEALQKVLTDIAKMKALPDAAAYMEKIVGLETNVLSIIHEPITPGAPSQGMPGAMAPPPSSGMPPMPMEMTGGMPGGMPGGLPGPGGRPMVQPPMTSPDELRRALAGPSSM